MKKDKQFNKFKKLGLEVLVSNTKDSLTDEFFHELFIDYKDSHDILGLKAKEWIEWFFNDYSECHPVMLTKNIEHL